MQRKLERVLGLIMDDIAVDYKIVIEEVRPFGPHIQVEFYAIRQDNHTPMNATKAYMKMTAKGQDYTYPNSNFHFVRIRMKGLVEAIEFSVAVELTLSLLHSMPAALLWPRVLRQKDPQM